MFPIYSMTGRVVGFGGRILDGDGAKYLNSPESRVFNKRHNLYLLNKAKAGDRVEGMRDTCRGLHGRDTRAPLRIYEHSRLSRQRRSLLCRPLS